MLQRYGKASCEFSPILFIKSKESGVSGVSGDSDINSIDRNAKKQNDQKSGTIAKQFYDDIVSEAVYSSNISDQALQIPASSVKCSDYVKNVKKISRKSSRAGIICSKRPVINEKQVFDKHYQKSGQDMKKVINNKSLKETTLKSEDCVFPNKCTADIDEEFSNSVIAKNTLQLEKSTFKPFKAVMHSTIPINPEIDDKNRPVALRDEHQFLRSVEEGDMETICRYMNTGIDVNTTDQFGWTALMIACYAGKSEVVEMLLNRGADRHPLNKSNQNAFNLTSQTAHSKKTKTAIMALLHGSDGNDTNTSVPQKTSLGIFFYCNVCKNSIKESNRSSHVTSTVHLFNLKLAPKSSSYSIPEHNRGFQLMVQSGWDQEKGLGPEGQGKKYPVKTVLKRNRLGLGSKVKESPKVTHFSANDEKSVKTSMPPVIRNMRISTLNKRKRTKLEVKEKRQEIKFRREFYTE